MAADPNPALRDELNTALAVVAPEIRGLHDLTTVSISDDLRGAINGQITARERRRDLIQNVISGLDAVVRSLQALEADGYPTLDPVVVQSTLFSELQGEIADLGAAAGVFKADQASRLSVALGAPTAKS